MSKKSIFEYFGITEERKEFLMQKLAEFLEELEGELNLDSLTPQDLVQLAKDLAESEEEYAGLILLYAVTYQQMGSIMGILEQLKNALYAKAGNDNSSG